MYTPDSKEKLDFENLDVRLYLCLKTAVLELEDFAKTGGYNTVHQAHLKTARETLYTFEQAAGPLPEWAVARNFGYELVAGTQLCTKDGRRMGNSWIVEVGQLVVSEEANRDNPYGEFQVYHCLSDVGSKFTMREAELLGYFHIGDWICSKERILTDFDRHNHFEEQPK